MKETLGRGNDIMVTMENIVEDDVEEFSQVAREELEYQLSREEEEATEAKQFLKVMLRNVENADARVERTRQRFSEEFVSHLNRWRREEGPVNFLSTQTFRKSQSSDTKSLNVHRLNNISGIVQRMIGMDDFGAMASKSCHLRILQGDVVLQRVAIGQ